jgi:hypothetical protein
MGLWKDIFGESQREVWLRLANELHGSFDAGGWAKAPKVTARLGGYDIVLDTYTVSTGQSSQTFTRMRAPFVNAGGLRFLIHRASIFTGMAKALGKQDIDVGEPGFDDDWVIQGSNVDRVRALLSDPTLRALIASQPRLRMQVVDNEGLFGPKYSDDVDVLQFTESGVIRDQQRLSRLFALFAAWLNAFRATSGAKDLLSVPPAEMPETFARVVEHFADAYGGSSARVGDDVEARLDAPVDDALGELGQAKLVVAIPSLPALRTHIHLAAPLPPGPSFRATKRGLVELGDTLAAGPRVDASLVVRGDQAAAAVLARVERPLADLARVTPVIDASDRELVVDVDLDAAWAPFAIGAALDLWSELCRVRLE